VPSQAGEEDLVAGVVAVGAPGALLGQKARLELLGLSECCFHFVNAIEMCEANGVPEVLICFVGPQADGPTHPTLGELRLSTRQQCARQHRHIVRSIWIARVDLKSPLNLRNPFVGPAGEIQAIAERHVPVGFVGIELQRT